MKKLCGLLLIFVVLFAGCGNNMPTDLFAVPEMSETHSALLDTVDGVRAEGFEFAEPRSGLNRQPLQIMDLDGDGEEEGIAFLRDIADTYKTFIYVFENSNSVFSLFDIIESDAKEIYTVAYSDLLGGSGYEIIVEWGTQGEGAHPITAYTLESDGVEKIFDISASLYSVNDFDGDGNNELITVTKEDDVFFADIYKKTDGKISKQSSVPLSGGGGTVIRIMSGKVTSKKMGAFIERKVGDGIMTDLIVADGSDYKNILPRGVFCSVSALSADINGDGTIEIPKTTGVEAGAATDRTYLWTEVFDDGVLIPEVFTYHSFSENWYVSMPLAWSTTVTAERYGQNSRQTEIRFVTREKTGGNEEFIEAPLFTIYVLSGDMREDLASREGLFIISKRDDVIFAGEILSPSYLGTEITEEFVKTAFKNRESEWASEILFA